LKSFRARKSATLGALEQVARRLNGMYWKERTLSCSTVLR
jgi:hypothetical protein